jgi:hypothetical protein
MAQAWAAGELQEGRCLSIQTSTNAALPSTQPIDQANAILYLASDKSKAVTGRVLTVDNSVESSNRMGLGRDSTCIIIKNWRRLFYIII